MTNRAGLQVVDVPANNLLAVVAKNDLPKSCAGVHPLHKREKPLQGIAVVFCPERIPPAELGQAVKERFDIKFSGMQRGLGVPKWTERESSAQAVHQAAKRSCSKL